MADAKTMRRFIIDADQIASCHRPRRARLVRCWKHSRKWPPEREIDRKKLASLIFEDEAKRRRLESIIHPLVFEQIKTEARILEQNGRVVFADIPLLYETNCQTWINFVVVVYVPEHVQLARLMQRDSLTEAEALRRIRAQWPIELKRQLADFVIDNSGTVLETQLQVDRLWQRIIE